MPAVDGIGSAAASNAGADLEPLLRAHLALQDELAAAIRRRLEVRGDDAELQRLEERCAGLLDRLLSHIGGLVNESMRRGIGPESVEAEFDRISGVKGGIDPSRLLAPADSAGPGASPIVAWRDGAERGRAAAQYHLGQALLLRPTSQKDVVDGIGWLERSAEQDYGPASLALALALSPGPGSKESTPRSLELLRAAADLGLAEAQWLLAGRHLSGEGAPQHVPNGLRYLESAANVGHAEAQLELGRLRAVGGPGLEIDHAEARRWLSLAAGQHRLLALEWMDRYGNLSPREYRSRTWLEAWTPSELPPPPRAGTLGLLVSLGLLALLIAGAVAGNSLGLFLLVAFIAIVLHETGHWIVARMVGIPILVFSVGIGPLVRSFPWGKDRLPMRIDLRLLPLMGSVRPYVAPRGIWDHWQESFRREDAGQAPPPLPEFDRTEEPEPVFLHVPRTSRLAFLVGGLAVNLVFAIGGFWVYEHASDAARMWTVPVAGPVPAGSVAEQAGIREGDRFVTVDGRPVRGFFVARRRLAPQDASGVAGPPQDPPGHRVPVVVRRGDSELSLEWPTPAAPPTGDALAIYGLSPPESWIVGRIHGSATRDLVPGDQVVEFQSAGRMVKTDEPGARRLFDEAFSTGPGSTVRLVTLRDGQRMDASAGPSFGSDARGPGSGVGRPPFSFAPPREIGPPRGFVEIVGRVFQIGWDSVIGLPRTIVRSLRSVPSREDRGALMVAVREDPWEAVRLFAWLHVFLLFLNLIPIPPLDGFQILCCMLEMLARRPLPRGGVLVAARAGWVIMGLWLLLNVFLILRDLTVSVF